MFRESLLDKILYKIKRLIPKSVFETAAPVYHSLLAWAGAVMYGFPSKSLTVIGVTGTKGKSTVTYLISKILESNGASVAAIGSLGYKIRDKEWPNTLKMTMPGRSKLQKFLSQAKKAGCKYVVLEVTSEGIKQKRHLGITFDCAVFTNLHKEHIESHGSFEKYYEAKQELFKAAKNIHVINSDDPNFELFSEFPSRKTIFYGINTGEMKAANIKTSDNGSEFDVYGTQFKTSLAGEFNILNCLAALATGAMYGVELPAAKPILESIRSISGRMEFIQHEPFSVVVDYAHTPDSLEVVYRSLKKKSGKLICVLGSAGGGRDRCLYLGAGCGHSLSCSVASFRLFQGSLDDAMLPNIEYYVKDIESFEKGVAEGRKKERADISKELSVLLDKIKA